VAALLAYLRKSVNESREDSERANALADTVLDQLAQQVRLLLRAVDRDCRFGSISRSAKARLDRADT